MTRASRSRTVSRNFDPNSIQRDTVWYLEHPRESDDSLNSQIRLFLEMLSSQAGYLLHGFVYEQNPSEVVQEEPAISSGKDSISNWKTFREISTPETPSIQL